jgi:DNA-binding CsgD family transcriptional regulator
VERFEAACVQERSGAALEGLARAHYVRTDYRAAVVAHEDAYAAYRRESDLLGAARVARMLAWITGNVFGEWAVRAGWIARARTVLADQDEASAARGWLLMLDAQTEPDHDRKLDWYEQARHLGPRFGDPALEIEALGWLGLQTALTGDVDRGLRLLDEALAAVVSGEVEELYVVEGTFCGLFWACERFHDVARAEQWVRAAESLQRRRLVGVAGFCRAHYGGILTTAGRWVEADAQLNEAARLFERGYAALKASVEVRLAELRVLQGRLEDAQQLLNAVGEHPDATRPLAMLHLTEGRNALAREVLERRLDDPDLDHDIAAPLWGLLVDVQLAEDDLEGAGASVSRLETIAAERPSVGFVVATAALARGRLCLARHDPEAAACFRDALAVFARAQVPVHVAHVRLDLARALATEKPDVAAAEATAALDAYRSLGARRDADAAAALLRRLGVATRAGPKGGELTERESQVLALLAAGLSNGEIAQRLYLSRKTVEHHVSHLFTKLGVRNRTEAARHVGGASGERGSG